MEWTPLPEAVPGLGLCACCGSIAAAIGASWPSVAQLCYRRSTQGRSLPPNGAYPRLAEELLRIGAPPEDRIELFGRMIFNAVCGNDDDHPRNHAVIFDPGQRRWRLSPAFDVVPNPDPGVPPALAMQVSLGTTGISRASVLADYIRFGFRTVQDATAHLAQLLARMEGAFRETAQGLAAELRDLLEDRMDKQVRHMRE